MGVGQAVVRSPYKNIGQHLRWCIVSQGSSLGGLVRIGRESYLYVTKSYNFMIYTFLKGCSHGDVSDTPTKERKKFREVNFN